MRVTFKRKNGVLIAELYGELDHHCAEYVRNELDKRLRDAAITELVFDLKGLAFMDSSGIGVLLGRYKKINARDGSVSVMHANSHVSRILRMAGLNKIIRIV